MKKFVSLVLTVCVLLMAVVGAVAEEQTVRVVLQDTSAPVLATVKCADGEDAYAVIYGADGAEVAHVTDAAQIQLIDMTGAEHAAALTNGALSQHHMVTELFSVVLPADVVVPEGGYVEMAFTVADTHPAPGAVKAGADVQDAAITAQEGKTVTVKLPALENVTFVVDFGIGKEAEDVYDGVIVPGEGAPSEMFTPSVSGKAAPSVIASVDGDGSVIVAKIGTVGSDDVVSVPDDGTMVVTPVSERDYVLDVRIHGGLEWAYETISVAKSLNDLPAVEPLGAAIDAALQAAGTDLTHNDMIVRDLFSVTLYGDLGEEVKAVDKYLDIKFDLGVAAGTPVIALVSVDNVNWSVLPAEDVQVNADGTVAIDLHELGNVAFAVPAGNQGAVTSPATGE